MHRDHEGAPARPETSNTAFSDHGIIYATTAAKYWQVPRGRYSL